MTEREQLARLQRLVDEQMRLIVEQKKHIWMQERFIELCQGWRPAADAAAERAASCGPALTERIARLILSGRDAAAAERDYHARVAPWVELLKGIGERHRIEPHAIGLNLAKQLHGVGLLDGAAAMWLLAALYEILRKP